IFERNGSPRCNRGRIIKCGQTIRLMHLNTRKNLHSHHFQSPLSHNFEVSAFGNGGVGDEGDDWQVICDGPYWLRKSRIQLKHISTEGRLERWVEHIEGQFNWPPASTALLPQTGNVVPWSVDLEALTETEVRNCIAVLKRNKAAGPADLVPALFKEGRE
ncbi:uncharacterized protein DEA37_0003568, partial [Paragonimus westermani]